MKKRINYLTKNCFEKKVKVWRTVKRVINKLYERKKKKKRLSFYKQRCNFGVGDWWYQHHKPYMDLVMTWLSS
jgi:hypothetical protein